MEHLFSSHSCMINSINLFMPYFISLLSKIFTTVNIFLLFRKHAQTHTCCSHTHSNLDAIMREISIILWKLRDRRTTLL